MGLCFAVVCYKRALLSEWLGELLGAFFGRVAELYQAFGFRLRLITKRCTSEVPSYS